MKRTDPEIYRFSNLRGSREEWIPSLKLTYNEFWDRVRGCFAVFIPACYWRILIRQGDLISIPKGFTIVSSGNFPTGVYNGVHIYTDVFNEEPKRLCTPIVLIHPVQCPHYD